MKELDEMTFKIFSSLEFYCMTTIFAIIAFLLLLLETSNGDFRDKKGL